MDHASGLGQELPYVDADLTGCVSKPVEYAALQVVRGGQTLAGKRLS